MSKNILSIFHLQDIGYSLTAFDILEEEIHLGLMPTSLASCPRCGQSSRRVHEKGKWWKVYHGYGFGRKVYLRLRKSRYFCSTCQRAFTKRLPLIPPWQRHTKGAEKQIIDTVCVWSSPLRALKM